MSSDIEETSLEVPEKYSARFCKHLHTELDKRLAWTVENAKDNLEAVKKAIITKLTLKEEYDEKVDHLRRASMLEALETIKSDYKDLKAACDKKAVDFEAKVLKVKDDQGIKNKSLDEKIEALEILRNKLWGAYILFMLIYPTLTSIGLYFLFKAFH